ncbi:rab3 GTPase-activating protein non-catalytic subunit isoform X1 [Strongylocentrotus purpuratus]|uniref:Rab3 GTPase-activating protein non-catalytic subunit n=1 Tax=Strongylocentrotus purpuratus TaxID=7668 RepID=A0A7M7PNY0_STRPU|nr:rab3 GTPase-activating protein non-catalytic subunit isoform X1 [Strongylocentrotus purpuratus]
MSCVLTNVGCFYDIAAVQRYLFPNWKKDEGGKDTDGWEDADWSWSGEESNSVSLNVKTSLNAVAFQKEGSEVEAGPPDQDAWMQECSIALSPTSELMVIAFEQKAVFLQQKWDPEEKDGVDNKYHIIYKGMLNQEEGECITCAMCVPLASQKRSSHGAPDWTCVVLGFTSGYVRMYTETGSLLLSQLLHEDPVLKLKGRTYEMPRHAGVAEQQEELTILYPTALVTVDGFSLFQSLRACRNQLAKAAASGSDNILPPPLAYKKWGLQQQDAIVDHISTGVVTSYSFDQLHAASTLGGYNASIKKSPPICHKYITTGAGPFLGFFYALEGSAQPLFSDVALAVASKLKSAIFSAASGWFGFGGNKQTTDTPAPSKTSKPRVEPAISLPIRFGLPDVRRHGDTIVLAPGMRLAASTDSFGRVSLIDVTRGVAVRMWKGYRDAQCGWIQVIEDIHRERTSEHGSKRPRHSTDSKHGPRVALFLVIYAPRRGIIEVWNTQQGPRVAAFNVPKSCRLLYPGYGVMGLNSLSVQDSRTRPHMLQCCLLEPSGLVRTFNVPFHLALSDKNSKRAHDLHLIKKLSSLLHHRRSLKEPIVEPISKILQDLKLTAYKQQALDKAFSAKGMSSEELFHIIRVLINQLGGQDPSCMDYESRRLLQYCGCQVKLIEAYIKIQGLLGKAETMEGGEERVAAMERTEEGVEGNETGERGVEDPKEESGSGSISRITPKDLASKLKQDLTSVESLLDDLSSYLSSSGQARVHFASDYSMDPATFLSCFKTVVQRANKEGKEEGTMQGDETEEKQEENEEEEVTALTEELKMKVTFKENLAEEKRLTLGMYMFKPCLVDSCSSYELCEVFRDTEIGSHDIKMLLLQVWLHNENEFLKDPITTTANLHSLMTEVSAPTMPFSPRPLGGVNISPGEMEIIHGLLYETRHVCGAEVAGMVMRSLVSDIDRHKGADYKGLLDSDQMDVDGDPVTTPSSDLSPDWVDVSMWEVLIEQLRDLMVLQRLLQTKLNKATSSRLQKDYSRGWSIEGSLPPIDVTVPDISVKHVMEGGKGIFAEMVARWVAHYRIPPGFLSKCSVSSHALNLSRESSRVDDTNVEQDHDETAAIEQLQETFHTLCSRFPHSLDHDVLQAHCTWEYVVQWNKNPEITGFLACGLYHLRSIRNPVLQHGVSSMMWHTFMVKKVSATTFLMDKVGKAPKDRLCRRDVGLGETAIGKFLGFATDLLDCIYQVEAESSLTPIFDVEDLWQHIQGPAPLVELAVNQTLPNHSLVDVHKQLCTIMHAVMTFSIKSVKVLQFFDYKTKNAFFKALGTTFIPSTHEIDYGLVKLRQQFLLRLVTAATLTLPPNHQSEPDTTRRTTSDRRDSTVSTDEGGNIVPLDNPKKLPKTHLAYVWCNVAQQLALALRVDCDYVKRHFVCELYNSGYDAVAQELVVTVAEQTEMAVQLIHIVGQRLAQELIIGADSVTVERQSRLPPSLITWLKALSGESLRCPHPPISDTAHLAGQAVGLLPDTHNQYALALQLIEAVGSLT